ncbi:MAG: ABC transporter permease [Patescibacteria group bacterium]
MSNILTIIKKELYSYFFSPVAYVVFTMYLVLAGYFFTVILLFTKEASLSGAFYNIVITLLFIIPLITMRLFAEERKLGTLEILLTKPVKDFEVVFGKFFAAVIFFIAMLATSLVYVAILFKYGNPDIGPLVSGYLAVLFVGMAFIALGLFASTLSENQIIAAVISFALILLMWILNWVSGQLGTSQEGLLSYFSLSYHFDDFIRGVIDLKGLIYYLSFIVFWLFIALKSIEVRKWK